MLSALSVTRPVEASPAPRSQRWLFSAKTDLCFIANLGWPVWAALLVFISNRFFQSGVLVYAYFVLTIPHRWITMGVIFTDRKRLDAQKWILLSVAVATLLLYASLWYLAGFAVVVAVRYFWNSWHSVSQHIGIARVYLIRAEPQVPAPRDRIAQWLLKFFMLYALARLLGSGISLEDQQFLGNVDFVDLSRYQTLDYFVLLIPLFFLIREWRRATSARLGRTLYVTSICLNYAALLTAVH